MAFKKAKGGRFDKELQENGKWVDYDGGKFKVASIASPKFIKGYTALDTDTENLTEEQSKEFSLKLNTLLAETILLDWEGVVDEDDKEEKYTVEGGIELLEEDAVFASWLLNFTKEVNNYKREAVAKKAKK